jgi:CO/xanthine dehydrogenase Mo-binding subunit
LKEPFEKAHAEGKYAGIACAFKNSGIGVGLRDIGRCILSVESVSDTPDAHNPPLQGTHIIHIRTSAACIGQGLATVLIQIACETLSSPKGSGILPEQFIVEPPDTQRTPDSGTTTASRQTVFTGGAVRQAALKLKAALERAGGDLRKLEGEEFYGEFSGITDPMGSDKPNPVSHVAYGYAATMAVIDSEGKVEKLIAAYDMGTVVNPKSAEGQIEGGLLMGMGYALTEDFPMENGYPKAKYGTLGLLRATDAPQMEIILVQPKARQAEANPDISPPALAFGVKGAGELATIPVTPAIAGAYYAKDNILRQKLPMENTFYHK